MQGGGLWSSLFLEKGTARYSSRRNLAPRGTYGTNGLDLARTLSLHPGAQRLGTTTVYWIGGDLLCSTFLKSPSMGPEELELRVYSRQSPRRVEHRIAIIALPAARLLSPGGCPSLGSQQGREVQRVNHSAMLASINGFIVRSSLIKHEAPFSSRCACP